MRFWGTWLAALVLAGTAPAHFVFIVPDESGATAQVVFSDNLDPDDGVKIALIADTGFTVRGTEGAPTPLTSSPGDHCLKLTLPGTGPRTVQGTTTFGVLQKGQSGPFLLRYLSKALVGPADPAPAELKAELELVPVRTADAVRLRVVAAGKPVPTNEVTVIDGNGKSKKLTTDADGLTPALEGTGRLGAWTKRFEKSAGEHAGKKYDEVRTYATLVFVVGTAKK
jgi:uncharacterized GH25 family protein